MVPRKRLKKIKCADASLGNDERRHVQYERFLDRAIDYVIDEVIRRHAPGYSVHITKMLEECRRMSPEALNEKILVTNQAYIDSLTNEETVGNLPLISTRELEWLCNIVSAFLASQGEAPIIMPNDAGNQVMRKIIAKDTAKK